MILNGDECHYIAVKALSLALRGITSKNNSNFYFLSCLHSFRTKNKHDLHKKVCENKDFCAVVIFFEDTKVLEFIQY